MSVKLLEERQLFRRFEISMPGAAATYLVEWLAGVSKNDTVAVDGQVVAAGGGWGKSQDFRFRIGDQEALLSVQLSMMKKVTSLKLIVGEEVVYTEGEALSSAAQGSTAQSSVSPDELEKLRSPLQPPKLVRRSAAEDAVVFSVRSSLSLGVLMMIIALLFAIILVWIGPGQGWIFVVGCLLICLVSLYYGLVKLINRTQVRLDRQNLTIQRGPLPTNQKKGISLGTSEISSVTIQEISRRNNKNAATKHFYQLQAQRKTGEPWFMEQSELAAHRRLYPKRAQPISKENPAFLKKSSEVRIRS